MKWLNIWVLKPGLTYLNNNKNIKRQVYGLVFLCCFLHWDMLKCYLSILGGVIIVNCKMDC